MTLPADDCNPTFITRAAILHVQFLPFITLRVSHLGYYTVFANSQKAIHILFRLLL